MTLFRLDASIRTEGSASRELADVIEEQWLGAHPEDQVTRRDVGIDPIPATAWGLATFAGYTPAEQRTEDERAALALAATLVDEITTADALLLAVPLYNFGVSQHFKAWVDLIISDPRSANGTARLLDGKPVVLTLVRGGAYGPGSPREGWDHATAYAVRMLREVWGAELSVVEREFTLVGVNPALDAFTDLAAQLHAAALDDARQSGKELGARAA